ncbi:VOC family protein [Derxia gummosa]|uniref:VOC family protein n=1 Tax=Derxia gummosa DSM 723 TaxID=1121388 RepID=A0A8B6X367_9BURK|nr:VOC family protein [Derxia gummosa]
MSAQVFVWYELLTTDTAAAAAFYGRVLGWTATPSALTDVDYTHLSVGEHAVAGLMRLPAEAAALGARPCWMGHLGTPDIDAAVARLVAAGGKVWRPAWDIPEVGRLAVVADPQGAAYSLYQPAPACADSAPLPPMTPGSIGWRELQAVDGPSAFDFYAAQYGWTRGEAIDMGPMGVYQLFEVDGLALGGVMTKPAHLPIPFWLFYFAVADIDAAVTALREAGGTLLNGPMPVPGGAWIVQALDPQGVLFALVGMRAAG